MALDLSGNWREELLRARLAQQADAGPARGPLARTSRPDAPVTMAALAGLPLDRLAAALPEAPPPGIGSNVWVADGSRTASGLPLLANDPHLRLQMPGHWYLAHLEAPGLAVIGATLPGLPFVVLGRNRDIAWGFTNTGSDTQDLFVERIDPADPGRYLTPDGSVPFRERAPRRSTCATAPPVTLDVRETRHGPVISDLVPAAAALGRRRPRAGARLDAARRHRHDDRRRASRSAGPTTGRASWRRSSSTRAPSRTWPSPTGAGGIGMISPGLVPVRRGGDGRLPVPGWTGAHDWMGTIPPASCRAESQPAAGLLVNANNRLVDDELSAPPDQRLGPAAPRRAGSRRCWAPSRPRTPSGSPRSSSTSPRRWRSSSCPICWPSTTAGAARRRADRRRWRSGTGG